MSLYDIAVAKAICGSGGGGGYVAIVDGELQASYNDLMGMVDSGVLPWTVYEDAGTTMVAVLSTLTNSGGYQATFNYGADALIAYGESATANMVLD